MIQLDRVIYATSCPDEVDKVLTDEHCLQLIATGASFPGIGTRIYELPGGGTFEIAHIMDETKVETTEQGLAFLNHLKEHGDSYYGMVLEAFDLMGVRNILEAEGYPVEVTPVHEMVDQNGENMMFQMLGSSPHLPWFIRYDKPRQHKRGFPQAGIIRTASFASDVSLMEKILDNPALKGALPTMHTATIGLLNGTLRLESSDDYGFSYLAPTGLILDSMARYGI